MLKGMGNDQEGKKYEEEVRKTIMVSNAMNANLSKALKSKPGASKPAPTGYKPPGSAVKRPMPAKKPLGFSAKKPAVTFSAKKDVPLRVNGDAKIAKNHIYSKPKRN